jgi:hypothetical protein
MWQLLRLSSSLRIGLEFLCALCLGNFATTTVFSQERLNPAFFSNVCIDPGHGGPT